MPKRACILRQNNYPYDLLFRREAQALRAAGFQVDVICTRLPGAAAFEVLEGISVHRLPVATRKGSFLNYLYVYAAFFVLSALKLTGLHLKQRFSVIQVNNMPDFLVFTTLLPRLLGARVTLMMYEPMPELWDTLYHRTWAVKMLKVIQKFALKYADAVFAVTQQQKDTFVLQGVNPEKITVILNAPESSFWEAYDRTPAATHEHFTLICHGAIEERYGQDTMLQAIQMVKDDISTVQLRILGSGSWRDQFLAQIQAMHLEDYVQYLGWVPLPQLVKELANADVGIVAQKSSLYSNLVHTGKMYDYLDFCKPVLASRLKAVEAYFGEDALRYFEPGDAESLAEGILDLYHHPDKRHILVENSQRLYEQYKWDQQKKSYQAVCRLLAGD